MKTLFYSFLLLQSIVLAACSSSNTEVASAPAPQLKVITINSTTATTYTEYPATIEGESDVEIRPQVEGVLVKSFIDEGDYVTAGQALFKINDQAYAERFNDSKAELLAAKANILSAKLEVEKIKPLVENKVVADMQLKIAQSNYDLAVAREQQAQARLGNAKINLGYTIINAPVSGYIGRLYKKVGSVVSPADAQELTSLSDNHEVHVYFSLGENDFVKLKGVLSGATIDEKLNHAAAVTLLLADESVYPQAGKLDMIDGSFNRSTGAITLRATFPNAQGLLRSGNTGKIKLGYKQENVLSIPQASTIEIQDKVFVYAVGDSNKVYKKPLTISGSTGDSYLVTEGLNGGDRIVLEGLEGLKEGMVIQIEKPSVAQLK